MYSQCLELVWSEEFDGNGIPDETVWTYDVGGGGWGNNELQYYTLRDPDNIKVENGSLVITAREEAFGGRAYTSARIKTQDLKTFQYGRIEARMKLPFGQGLWPAFWMLGQSIDITGWPSCGEIDIMEMVGGSVRDGTTYGTIHFDRNGHGMLGGNTTLETGRLADAFHLYAIEWDHQRIEWSLDGVPFHSADITPVDLSELHQPFFLILNLAVGGNWPGSPDENTVFPQHFEVDYIRVYQTDGELEIKGPDDAASNQDLEFELPGDNSYLYNWSVPAGVTILSGQGTHALKTHWGCFDGNVTCELKTLCQTHQLKIPVRLNHDISGPYFTDPQNGNLVFGLPEMEDTVYAWSVPEGVHITSGQGTATLEVTWGTTEGAVHGSWENDCGVFERSHFVRFPGQYPYPNPEQPQMIPGTLQPTYFDYGGEGIAYHDTSPENEGDGIRPDESVDTEFKEDDGNLGWILAGEWLEYTVDIKQNDTYRVAVRVATELARGGPFRLFLNGEDLFSEIPVPSTGGWGQFTTLELGHIELSKGLGTLRFEAGPGGFNLGPIFFFASHYSDMVPHISPAEALFETELLFYNGSPQQLGVQLVPYRQDGNVLTPVDLQLNPFEMQRFDPYSQFKDPEVSHLRFNGQDSVGATVRFVRKGEGQMPAHATVDSRTTNQFRIHPGQWDLIWDGFAMVNAGSAPANLQIMQKKYDGTTVAESIPGLAILPNAKTLVVLNDLFSEVQDTFFDVEADQPCHMLALRGTHANFATSALFQVVPGRPMVDSGANWVTHLTPEQALFSTEFILENTGETNRNQTFSAFDLDGLNLGTMAFDIPGHQVVKVDALQWIQGASHLSFSVQEDILIGFSYTRKVTPAVTAHVQSALANYEWIVVPGHETLSWDGFAIANTSEEGNTVVIEQVQFSGDVLATELLPELPGFAKRLFLPAEHFPFRDFVYYRIRSTHPIAFLALRGTPNHEDIGILFETVATRNSHLTNIQSK